MLTERLLETVQWIDRFIRDNDGVSPTIGEIADGLSVNKGNAHRLVTALEERGFIRRLGYRARAMEVLRTIPGPTRIPIFDADTLQLRGYLP